MARLVIRTEQDALDYLTKRDALEDIIWTKDAETGESFTIYRAECGRCLGGKRFANWAHIAEGLCFLCGGKGYTASKRWTLIGFARRERQRETAALRREKELADRMAEMTPILEAVAFSFDAMTEQGEFISKAEAEARLKDAKAIKDRQDRHLSQARREQINAWSGISFHSTFEHAKGKQIAKRFAEKDQVERVEATEEGIAQAKAAIASVRALDPKVIEDMDHGFVREMLEAVLHDEVAAPKSGILCVACRIPSILERMTEREEREARWAEEKAQSEHVGEAGERITVDVKVERITWHDGRFGPTRLLKMRDAGGNLLVWWCSSSARDWTEGEAVTLVGTIKKHDEFRDEKQTILTRCRVA